SHFREGGEVSRTERFLSASGRLPRESRAGPPASRSGYRGFSPEFPMPSGAAPHENIPPFEGGQRSRRGREGDVQPAGIGTPPGQSHARNLSMVPFTLAPETPARRSCHRDKTDHVHPVPKRLSVRA